MRFSSLFAGFVAAALLGCGGSTVGMTDGGATADTSVDRAAADVRGEEATPPSLDATAEPTSMDAGDDASDATASGDASDTTVGDAESDATVGEAESDASNGGDAEGDASDATAMPDATESDATMVVDAPVVTSVVVTPDPMDLTCGTAQATATANYSDGSNANVSSQAAWSSSNTSIATVAPGGLVLCPVTGAQGDVTISATFSGVSGTAVAICVRPTVTSVAIAPQDASVAVGGTTQFSALATFANGIQCDLTPDASWQTATPSVATIASGASGGGLATGVSVGSTGVNATLFGLQAAPATLQVTESPVTGIVVTPSNPSLPLDCPVQMTALAQHADGTTTNVTAASTWSSSPTGIVTVDPSGFLKCLAVGITQVNASYGGQSGQTDVSCDATALVSLSVLPPDASIAVGATLQYAASGLYTSNQQCDLTRVAQWQSSAPSVASIVTGTPDAGLATGLEAGTSQISAAVGAISGNASLTVQ